MNRIKNRLNLFWMYGMKQEFTITKVTGKTGAVYYYYYAYDEHGKRIRFATGQNNKTRANQYCVELARQGKLIPKKATKFSFKDFAQPFFIWQKCPIVKETLARDGRYSRTFCENNRKCIDKHIIMRFGKLPLYDFGFSGQLVIKSSINF